MEYPTNKEEFYKLMDSNRKDIDSMNIPYSEKQRLYYLVDETIVRYEENEKTFAQMKESVKGINKGLDVIAENFSKITNSVIEIHKALPNIEKIIEFAKTTIRDKMVRENPNVIN